MLKKKGARAPAIDKSPNPSSLLIPYTVGSGVTKRTQFRLSVDNLGADKPSHITEEEWLGTCLNAWKAITPEQTIYDNLENAAKKILEGAKLPTADSAYSIPDGRPLSTEGLKANHGRSGTLLSLAEARGFHERIDIEWYAAKILVHLFAVRACLEKDKPRAAVAIAFELGMLAREMAIRFEYITGYTQKGGSQKKRIPSVLRFIRNRLRKNISLTAAALWRQIPRDDSELQIGKAKLFVNRGRLCVMENQGKNWKERGNLSFHAFRKYVTVVRKDLAR